MVNELDEEGWQTLLERIQDGKCTPFLGAGVNYGILPLARDIAEEWAKEHKYPLESSSELDKVAQFLAIRKDAMYPKEKIIKLLKRRLEDWYRDNNVDLKKFFTAHDELLGALAELPLPVYLTTNYDDLLLAALRVYNKDPRREFCRWNKYVRGRPSVFAPPSGFEPTVANPVVFHLHGHDQVPESLVLTEDDYLDFLVNITKHQVLPPRIEEALTGTSLLFVGYRLADLNFRVIFRGLVGAMESSLRRINVSVQLRPSGQDQERQQVQDYLVRYFGNLQASVYWGTAREFAAELRQRWARFISR